MSGEANEKSDVPENEAWWRAQALALAIELSSVRGKYEAELDQLRRESGEAIEWLQKSLRESTQKSSGAGGRLKTWLVNLRND